MKNQDIFQGNPEKHTDSEKNLFGQYGKYFTESPLPNELKLLNFPKYIRRQDISRFLAKNELFKMQLDVPGVIIECGSYARGGLLTYAKISVFTNHIIIKGYFTVSILSQDFPP